MSTSLWSADAALARRLEAAEAANAFALVRGSLRLKPASGWEAEEILGGCAMFGGVGSPITHLLGGGMGGSFSAAEFDRLEAFFADRGSPCLIDLCPLADPSVLDQVFHRGYKVIELNNLLAMPLSGGPVPGHDRAEPSHDREGVGEGIRLIRPEEAHEFTRMVCQGFSPDDAVDDALVDAFGAMPLLSDSFVAVRDGQFAAGASVGLHNGVALFYGDATRAPWRGRGLQTDLIHTRLHHARAQGADLAMVTVVPGTASHRNYERAGFRLAYMRVNVSRDVI